MATRRVIHTFRDGDVKEVKEYHDGRYGAKGLPREKKRKPTQEQMAIVNAMNKAETARHRLLEYFGKKDYFLTLTYRVDARPPDMDQAKKDFSKLMDKLRRRYKKEEIELRWIRNIERGTKGAWHVHLIIPDAGIQSGGWRNAGHMVEFTQSSLKRANITRKTAHSLHPISRKVKKWEKRKKMAAGRSHGSVSPATVLPRICR